MPEVKDPRIKLFGKTIELQDGCASANLEAPESNKIKERYDERMMAAKGSRNLSLDIDAQPFQASKTEDQAETCVSPEKSSKKPETSIPCPRCDSKDTKFCYFNNYNTNQPRHFCKSCQRYWTAGGTMRNVPFGAGRRKMKNSGAQLRHIAVPDGFLDHPNGVHHAPLCESMVSSLNIDDEKVKNNLSNGFHRNRELGSLVYSDCDPSSESSSIASSKDVMGKKGVQEQIINCHPQIPCFPGSLWPYQWHPVRWNSTPSPSTFAYGSFQPQLYSNPPTFLGCTGPGSWTFPWLIPSTPTNGQTPPCTAPLSPTLGKHSRDENNQNSLERIQLVPKTLKIDDPVESAKGTLLHSNKDLFKGFQSQSKDKKKGNPDIETSTVLQANPAALSRSVMFHENS